MTLALAERTECRRLGRPQRRAIEEMLWRRIAGSLIDFLGVARTVDEHASQQGRAAVQPFPICAVCAKDPVANTAWTLTGAPPLQLATCLAHGRRHKPYFAPLAARFETDELTVAEKSRQMLATWFYVLAFGHLTMTTPGAKIGFQSTNETKAAGLVDRFALTYRLLPRELQRFGPLSDAPKAKARHTAGRIVFTHAQGITSELFAMPCGGNQTRMYTFTGLFMDECQFWEPDEDFEESWAAALPTVKGGGKLVAVSSVGAEGSYHHRLATGQSERAA